MKYKKPVVVYTILNKHLRYLVDLNTILNKNIIFSRHFTFYLVLPVMVSPVTIFTKQLN